MQFKLHSEYQPTGDQPQAIEKLVDGIQIGEKYQTLLGVTGSGKTFTVANVVQQVQKPTLVLAHNKTLAAQLFMEFKEFFPDNAVEYFVSYYDYYQPEAFIASTNTYIEKDLSINEEVEKLRLSATASLLSGRRDVLIVASVSCIYGIGNPTEFHKSLITLDKNDLNFSEQTNKYITYLGKIELEKIPSLYKKSNIVFIPTLLEVFSATYLEAMFMKKPIIASDMGFSRDICRESAYFCNPIDPEEYAKAIYELASNESLRNKLVNNGTENLKRFGTSMDRTQKYLEIIKEYANQK